MENGKYFIGLDVGTDSLGYAVTDTEYSLMKHKEEPMWGTHVFECSDTSEKRRVFRTGRRRLDRRQQRVLLIQELFAKEIAKIDCKFFERIHYSTLVASDKDCESGLFADELMNDTVYYRKYPTIHHLLYELISDPSEHDVRLVYLACAWLVAHRGHFLSDVSKNNIEGLTDFKTIYNAFYDYFDDTKPWEYVDPSKILEIMENGKNITAKKKAFKGLLFDGKEPEQNDDFPYGRAAIVKLLSGGQCKLSELLASQQDIADINVSASMSDEEYEKLLFELQDDAELIRHIKSLVDCVELKRLMGESTCISKEKVNVYESHKADLRYLKAFTKKYCPEKYKDIFVNKIAGNYVAYSKNTKSVKRGMLPEECATREDFCKYVKGIVSKVNVSEEDKPEYDDMLSRLGDNTFMPKQVNGDNRLIPYQLYWCELKKILENASEYLPFLKECDTNNISVFEKILSVFEFRVPYFVGPLNEKSAHAWIKKKSEGRILPWNFVDKVDLEASEQEFIRKMTNKCTYLPGEDVLPKASLLYQRFEVLNEINTIRIDGNGIDTDIKQSIFTELFVNSKKKVTKKQIHDKLVMLGIIDKESVISGVDDQLKSKLSTYHSFKRLIDSKTLSENDVECIVLQSTVTADRNRFKEWLKNKFSQLNDDDVNYIATVKCKDFGRLSRALLGGGVLHLDKSTGELCSIIDMMWKSNNNLNELLSDRFDFNTEIQKMREEYFSLSPKSLTEKFYAMYLSNAVRRPIIRTLDVVSDIVKANGGHAPEKIFIEMARGDEPEKKGKRTKSRYDQLIELYEKTEEDVRELQKQLDDMGDDANNKLQSDKLFLYYLQLGKSAYSGKHIELSDLANDSITNIDHIYPRSRVADDSILNNKVLCLSEENGTKDNTYPVPAEWRHTMMPFWLRLKRSGFMTEEKFKRLTRSTPFSDEEKWGFINRQLVETRQSTKALATILKEKYQNSEIVYVKAGMVSDFRQEYRFVKSRCVNDLHHAKDAYLNIVVGNVYNCKFTKRFFEKHRDDYSLKLPATFGDYNKQSREWKGTKYFGDDNIATVRKTMAKNNIHYTTYSFCKRGGLFDQMPLKAKSGLVSLKKGMPTEIYGGYNKPSASFFTLARFVQRKKVELMLVPVELMHANEFDNIKTALSYTESQVEEITGRPISDLSLPFGLRRIKIKTVFELDGFRVCLNGKSGEKVLLSPMNPLILSPDDEAYIKHIERFCEKRKSNSNLKYSQKYDIINPEDNLKLFDKLIAKIEAFYYKRPTLMIEKIEESRESFTALSVDKQAQHLLQFMALFGRRAEKSSIIDIGCGVCNLSAKLSNWAKSYDEVYIIDTTASGLYEKRSQNLLELLK